MSIIQKLYRYELYLKLKFHQNNFHNHISQTEARFLPSIPFNFLY
jgi:hypothetical protein